MSGSLTQFGIGKETVYGTAVAVNKFYEIISEDFKGNYPRLQAEALSSALVDRSDRYAVGNKGAAGSVTLEPLTKGFGNLLRYMMGDCVTSGPTETSVYQHTAAQQSLTGDSLTVQVGRAQADGTVKPWTYEGGKVTGFEFSNQVDQTLRSQISFDFEAESNPDTPAGNYVLATNVPVTGAEVLTWMGGTITVGGTAIDIAEFSVKVDNSLKTDRYFVNKSAGATKREPIQDGKRVIEWSFRTPYGDNAFWKKVAASTVAGSYAAIVAKWEGPTLLGTTIYPTLQLDIPVAVFNEGGPVVSGPSALEQTLQGRGLYDGTNSALTITYKSADATVI